MKVKNSLHWNSSTVMTGNNKCFNRYLLNLAQTEAVLQANLLKNKKVKFKQTPTFDKNSIFDRFSKPRSET